MTDLRDIKMNTMLLETHPSLEHQISYQHEHKQVRGVNVWGAVGIPAT
jgi:hypothetical protein